MKKHEHGGGTSRPFLDAGKILEQAGLQAGERVLDAGTGEGYFALAAARIVGGSGKVVAIDVYEPGLEKLKGEIAAQGIGNIEVRKADFTKPLPLPDGSIDTVLLVNVLHGIAANEETAAVMPELCRVLAPAGRLIVVDFKKEESPSGPPMDIRLDPPAVEELLRSCGFRIDAALEAGKWHYLLLFRK